MTVLGCLEIIFLLLVHAKLLTQKRCSFCIDKKQSFTSSWIHCNIFH